jgi:5-bromo-4-chloroindolyl phosphate hydrolysis protein
MSDQLETRVVRLEVYSKNHAEDIKELRETTIDLKGTMHSIEKNLSQIKYLALGALVVIIAQTIGLDKAIKVLFGA